MSSVEQGTSVHHPPAPATLPWYGVRTRSNYERLASVSLENKGYETYLPVYRTGAAGQTVRWKSTSLCFPATSSAASMPVSVSRSSPRPA